MSQENETKTELVPSRPTALFQSGAESLVTRGLSDLLVFDTAEYWRQKGNEACKQEDFSEAMRCYRIAADKGDEISMDNIGSLYLYGDLFDLEQDDAEAMRWYSMAAEKGYSRAMVNISELYSWGEGVPRDSAEVYFWLNLAASTSEEARKSRDWAGQQLSPEIRRQIQNRCERWVNEHPPIHN